MELLPGLAESLHVTFQNHFVQCFHLHLMLLCSRSTCVSSNSPFQFMLSQSHFKFTVMKNTYVNSFLKYTTIGWLGVSPVYIIQCAYENRQESISFIYIKGTLKDRRHVYQPKKIKTFCFQGGFIYQFTVIIWSENYLHF